MNKYRTFLHLVSVSAYTVRITKQVHLRCKVVYTHFDYRNHSKHSTLLSTPNKAPQFEEVTPDLSLFCLWYADETLHHRPTNSSYQQLSTCLCAIGGIEPPYLECIIVVLSREFIIYDAKRTEPTTQLQLPIYALNRHFSGSGRIRTYSAKGNGVTDRLTSPTVTHSHLKITNPYLHRPRLVVPSINKKLVWVERLERPTTSSQSQHSTY